MQTKDFFCFARTEKNSKMCYNKEIKLSLKFKNTNRIQELYKGRQSIDIKGKHWNKLNIIL